MKIILFKNEEKICRYNAVNYMSEKFPFLATVSHKRIFYRSRKFLRDDIIWRETVSYTEILKFSKTKFFSETFHVRYREVSSKKVPIEERYRMKN